MFIFCFQTPSQPTNPSRFNHSSLQVPKAKESVLAQSVSENARSPGAPGVRWSSTPPFPGATSRQKRGEGGFGWFRWKGLWRADGKDWTQEL